MVRDETVRDSLLHTEAELEKRQAVLTLVEIHELLDEIPTESLQPQEHERVVSLKHDTLNLVEELK